jgi:hypothetical protein
MSGRGRFSGAPEQAGRSGAWTFASITELFRAGAYDPKAILWLTGNPVPL